MVEEHIKYEWPEKETIIWRYLDFTKFIALLSSKSLFFTRADFFDDPFEGSLPYKTMLRRIEQFPNVQNTDRLIDPFCLKKRYYINCWHCNNYESAAMWKLYLDSNNGIAIKTTFERLKDSFIPDQQNKSHQINIGLVKYIDYETEDIDDSFACNRFLIKRKSFEHESELRATVLYDKTTTINGLSLQVDLNKLITSIYISPTANKWFGKLVEEVLKDYSLKIPLSKSEIFSEPHKLK